MARAIRNRQSATTPASAPVADLTDPTTDPTVQPTDTDPTTDLEPTTVTTTEINAEPATTEPMTNGLTANVDGRLADLDHADEPTTVPDAITGLPVAIDQPTDEPTELDDPSDERETPEQAAVHAAAQRQAARDAVSHAYASAIDQGSPVAADVDQAAVALRRVTPETDRNQVLADVHAVVTLDIRSAAMAPGLTPEQAQDAFNRAFDAGQVAAQVMSAVTTAIAAPPARPAAAPKPVDRYPGARALVAHLHAVDAARADLLARLDAWLTGDPNAETTRARAHQDGAVAWFGLSDEQRSSAVAQLNRAVRNAERTGARAAGSSPRPATANPSTGGQGGAVRPRDWSTVVGEDVRFRTQGTEYVGTIQDGGALLLNGETFKSTTAAALSVNGGTSVNGLKAWRLVSDGRTLQDAVPFA